MSGRARQRPHFIARAWSTVGNQTSDVKHGDTWLQSRDWTQGGARSVVLIGASDRVGNAGSNEPNGSISWGLLFKPHDQL
jgi:hypothetical protein